MLEVSAGKPLIIHLHGEFILFITDVHVKAPEYLTCVGRTLGTTKGFFGWTIFIAIDVLVTNFNLHSLRYCFRF